MSALRARTRAPHESAECRAPLAHAPLAQHARTHQRTSLLVARTPAHASLLPPHSLAESECRDFAAGFVESALLSVIRDALAGGLDLTAEPAAPAAPAATAAPRGASSGRVAVADDEEFLDELDVEGSSPHYEVNPEA